MLFVSWNVNGLRAVCGKGFADIFTEFNADFFCLQEIKLSEGQLDLNFPGYESYWNYAERKGYSGTAIFSRHKPVAVTYGIGIAEHDNEGRVITLEMPDFYLVTVYTPNSKDGLARLDYRMEWEEAFRKYLKGLDAVKPVIVCGDLNVAHKEIDLKNPSTNRRSAGFTDEERGCMTQLLESGFTDSFRHLHPDAEGAYSWWSYRMRARERNAGWRIDYFLVSDRIADRISQARIHADVFGSDHCPVSVELDSLEK
ncbi:MAG: exodeoxyribonuclease III [Muribaculaceae bacterium]|nr:exodeoxyribonuclease III [Muribaculaceae bacterium]MDE5930462.1 exodeoxyribonuclease III [Muribaculaceae bacterium]